MIEREIKFRLPEGMGAERVRKVVEGAGFRLSPGPALAHEDRYLDTDDWALYKAGLALRLRAGTNGTRLEAKTLRSSSDQALVRSEWSQEAPPGDPAWSSIDTGPVASLLEPLAGLQVLQRLRVCARLKNDRECFAFSRGETPLGSLTVDHVRALNGDDSPPVTFEEVEIELEPIPSRRSGSRPTSRPSSRPRSRRPAIGCRSGTSAHSWSVRPTG